MATSSGVAIGAAAGGFRRLLKANTVVGLVLSMATTGFLAMKKLRCSINTAVKHLRLGQCRIKTGDCRGQAGSRILK